MNASNYDLWSKYYDSDNKELSEINYVLTHYCGIGNPWKQMNVLEIGCGTGRFTKKIINEVNHIDAIDPDQDRIKYLQEYLEINKLTHKCSISIATFSEFLDTNNYEIQYDLIIFSWSWAFIPEDEKKVAIEGTFKLLKKDGVVISTMVEGGQFEEIVEGICSKSPSYHSNLAKNAKANETLRLLLLDKHVFISETLISSDFQFDNYEIMKKTIYNSIPQEINFTEEDIESYLINNPNCFSKNGEKHIVSDVVRCIVFKRISSIKENAKITFNYKLCDNRGDCSAAKECRKYRSAIVRIKDTNQSTYGTNRWGVLTDRCDPDLCGRKCESVCELFSVYRFWPEVYESLRQIEKTAIEPDFFDKDRYGSGSYNPAHRTKDFSTAYACLDKGKPIQILEISDERRHASSFDSVLITDLISKAYYDRYYTKYDIPKLEEESPERVTLYEDDHKYDDIYKKVFETFTIDELPAFLIISYGKIVFKYEGLLRSVDVDVVNALKDIISRTLSDLSERI